MRFLLSLLLTSLHGLNTSTTIKQASLKQKSTRRKAILQLSTLITFFSPSLSKADSNEELPLKAAEIHKAIGQLEQVPELIEKEKWDSVRAVLSKPPLSDMWAKNSPFLKSYTELLSDELAGLEAREETISRLRYLDMSVYNNIFNPISSEGTTGATKELIRSYYEDPTTELKASITGLQELENLSQ
ncbi:hypothetical protein ScalyP_jg4564 [Parmales sp. scaly parma]|nr:hypothetical protein ScalyP_jg4564 [Parmales sp. scaly parma]